MAGRIAVRDPASAAPERSRPTAPSSEPGEAISSPTAAAIFYPRTTNEPPVSRGLATFAVWVSAYVVAPWSVWIITITA
jgi:hypothetical protein